MKGERGKGSEGEGRVWGGGVFSYVTVGRDVLKQRVGSLGLQ